MTIETSTLNVLLGYGISASVLLQCWIVKKLHDLDKRQTLLEQALKIYETTQKYKDNILRLDHRSGGHSHSHRTDAP